jgi:hypothetical protein
VTASTLEFMLNEGGGSKEIVLNAFTTDDANCPIAAYTADLVSGVT